MSRASVQPIVIDLGKIGRSEVERLRDGSGQIAEDVKEVMRLLSQKDFPSDNRVFVPVVTLYSKAK